MCVCVCVYVCVLVFIEDGKFATTIKRAIYQGKEVVGGATKVADV